MLNLTKCFFKFYFISSHLHLFLSSSGWRWELFQIKYWSGKKKEYEYNSLFEIFTLHEYLQTYHLLLFIFIFKWEWNDFVSQIHWNVVCLFFYVSVRLSVCHLFSLPLSVFININVCPDYVYIFVFYQNIYTAINK